MRWGQKVLANLEIVKGSDLPFALGYYFSRGYMLFLGSLLLIVGVKISASAFCTETSSWCSVKADFMLALTQEARGQTVRG